MLNRQSIFNNKLSLLMGFAAGGVVGVLIGLTTAPKVDVNPEPTYELVQTVDGNAYIVDFNLSKSDCITQIRDNLSCVKE